VKRALLPPRSRAVLAFVVPLLALFVYVALRSGPLAPVAVTLATVQEQRIRPSLFGVGTVDAQYTHRIGPTFAARLQRLDVQPGDTVRAGQVLGEMDPVDLDDRVRSQQAAVKRAEAGLREVAARHAHAVAQASRYERLFERRLVSEEAVDTKREDLRIAEAAFAAAREELTRARSDREAFVAQRGSLRLISPVDGVVAARGADPGTTVVAGQAVVEVIDPASVWVDVRFDQIGAAGLRAGLPAQIALRSRGGEVLQGRVLRVEPRADAVTEETLAKVAFEVRPEPLPPIGELAEVTVELPALGPAPVVPNAALRRDGDIPGVWRVVDGDLHYTPVRLGVADLEGRVQTLEGLRAGDRVVWHAERALGRQSRIRVVEHIPGVR
jgi:RND family efflux transporter MFP subunit